MAPAQELEAGLLGGLFDRVVHGRGDGALLLGGGNAGAEGFHEVRHPAGRDGGGGHGLLGAQLALDDPFESQAVLVLVADGVVRGGELVDEHGGHGHLLPGDGGPLFGQLQLVVPPYLVGVEHGVHGQAVLEGAEAADVLLLAQGDLGQGHPVGALQCLLHEVEGFDAHGVGLEDVGALEADGVDGGEVAELGDLDGVRGGDGEVIEVALLHDDVLLLGVLVGAGDLRGFDLHLVGGAEAAVTEAGVAGAVEGDEGDVLALGGGVELDGDGDHPKADQALPDSSSRHDRTSLGCALTPTLSQRRVDDSSPYGATLRDGRPPVDSPDSRLPPRMVVM